jgi:hypothetical protein
MWRALTESRPGTPENQSSPESFHDMEDPPSHTSPSHVERTSSSSTGDHSEGSDDASNGMGSHNKVEHALSHLAEHGGVQKLNALLANAIPPQLAIPDT